MQLFVIAMLMAGCGCRGWGYGAGVDPGDDPEWQGQVAEAVQIWNEAMESKCGSPAFYIEDGGHPIVQLSVEKWQAKYRDRPTYAAGNYNDWDEAIYIKDLSWIEYERAVLVHEMGHALGLAHVKPSDDPNSVMIEDNDPARYIPSRNDINNVECD